MANAAVQASPGPSLNSGSPQLKTLGAFDGRYFEVRVPASPQPGDVAQLAGLHTHVILNSGVTASLSGAIVSVTSYC